MKTANEGRTGRRSRDDLRRETLAAARRIIAAEGPEALSARKLAKAVGYAPGTIYNLFDSLPDVLWQVNRENFHRLAGIFDDLPASEPEHRLRELARRYVTLVETETTLFRALFEGPRVTESFPQWYRDAINELLGRIAGELMALAPALTGAGAAREASALFAAVQGIASLQVSGRLDLISDEPAVSLTDGLIGRILRDIEAQGK